MLLAKVYKKTTVGSWKKNWGMKLGYNFEEII